jgi:hypothetical protein
MSCAPGLIFGGIEDVESRFHILSSRSRFPRYRGRQDPFSFFALPDSFSAVLSATCPVFDSTEVFESRFHVFLSRTRFRRHRDWRVNFSCFELLDFFSAVPRASGPVFMFCASRLVFGGTGCDMTHFHVLHARTHFRRYRGCLLLFSCFELPDSFSAVLRASGLVFMFCAPRLIFGGTEGVWSCFHVLRSQTCFWRCGGRSLSF